MPSSKNFLSTSMSTSLFYNLWDSILFLRPSPLIPLPLMNLMVKLGWKWESERVPVSKLLTKSFVTRIPFSPSPYINEAMKHCHISTMFQPLKVCGRSMSLFSAFFRFFHPSFTLLFGLPVRVNSIFIFKFCIHLALLWLKIMSI